MNKVDLSVVTASAVIASQLAIGVGHSDFVSALSAVSILNGTTVQGSVGEIKFPDSAESVSVGLPVRTTGGERWTTPEKNRYRKLVVKFACSSLSESEKEQLRELESTRARFEDSRTPQEILQEFRTRRLYADLSKSLQNASNGLRR